MDDVVAFVVLIGTFALGAVLGITIGVDASDKKWAKDCEVLKIHRDGDRIYKCEKQP